VGAIKTSLHHHADIYTYDVVRRGLARTEEAEGVVCSRKPTATTTSPKLAGTGRTTQYAAYLSCHLSMRPVGVKLFFRRDHSAVLCVRGLHPSFQFNYMYSCFFLATTRGFHAKSVLLAADYRPQLAYSCHDFKQSHSAH
jgi:hypothetical protein